MHKGPSSLRITLVNGRVTTSDVELTPIHDNIPYTAVNGIDGRTEYEKGSQRVRLIQSVETKTHVVEDRKHVLSAVDKVRKDVLRIIVTAYALQGSPYPW